MRWAPTSDQVAQAGTSYDWLACHGDVLHWVESSPQTASAVVMSWHLSRGHHRPGPNLAGVGVGSGLHAYGGKPYAVLPSGGMALVSASTGRIMGDTVLTGDEHSYGDLASFGAELLCVREDDRGDELVTIDVATGRLRVLLATGGFLASPRPWAGRLAWTQWPMDVMPWDSCEVWVAAYDPGGQIGAPRHVAGGLTESAFQPQWSDDGALYFMSDRTGWWNLYRWRDGRIEEVAPLEGECAAAPWESTYANYALLPNGRVAMTVQNGPFHQLVIVEADGGILPVELPYTSIKPYLAAVGDRVALIGASPTRSQEIALVTTDGLNDLEVIRSGSTIVGHRLGLSVPEMMSTSSGDTEVTVVFYPPVGGIRPAPLIVRPHAGPTYNSELRLDWEVQFFTSRGFAVAEVDYRGSTGYGRAFRKALDGNWGRFDVEDCRNAARHLVATGRALPEAVFISGASAGGYTALQAVCMEGPFSLAVARSAIVDPVRWASTAPRFQQPHAAILAHDDAKVAPERIQRPVLLIHGDEDAVAPVDDVATLATGLEKRRLLVDMLRLEGIGHYLSAPRVLAAVLEAELAAYRTIINDAGLPLPG